MERVSGTPYSSTESAVEMEKVAAAIRHIWSLPLPPQAKISPLGGDNHIGWFFGDCFGRTFETTRDLRDWINKELEDDGHEERVELPDERHICHGNLRRRNILRGPQGVTIINWEMSGVYPLAFEEYGLFRNSTPHSSGFARCLHRELFGPGLTENMSPIHKVAIINMVGSCRPRTLRLPDYP
jgi:thiamine kinase-like enzyme